MSRRFDLKQIIVASCMFGLMLSPTLSKAQDGEDEPIAFGAKAGLNVNSFDLTLIPIFMMVFP